MCLLKWYLGRVFFDEIILKVPLFTKIKVVNIDAQNGTLQQYWIYSLKTQLMVLCIHSFPILAQLKYFDIRSNLTQRRLHFSFSFRIENKIRNHQICTNLLDNTIENNRGTEKIKHYQDKFVGIGLSYSSYSWPLEGRYNRKFYSERWYYRYWRKKF